MPFDYKKERKQNLNAIKPVASKTALDNGPWVPISVAALLLRVSPQTVRIKIFRGEISAIKFPVGPILVDINSYGPL